MGSLGTGGGGGLREKLEGSTIVDLLTVFVLAGDFMLLRKAGTSGFSSPSSLFEISMNPEFLAAQLTGLLLVIYVVEAVIDKSGH
ncbi:MAG: hypothetical protein ABEK04_00735 [Candidatus Nanohalobium sp.]